MVFSDDTNVVPIDGVGATVGLSLSTVELGATEIVVA